MEPSTPAAPTVVTRGELYGLMLATLLGSACALTALPAATLNRLLGIPGRLAGIALPVGIIAAVKEVGVTIPVVVRLEGTNVEQGKAILANSGLAIVPANDLGDAAKKIVAEVQSAA